MRQSGMTDQQIGDQLAREKFDVQIINAAMAQADAQMGGAPMPAPPEIPGQPQYGPSPETPGPDQGVAEIETESEDVEALVEKLVAEKTSNLEGRLKDMESEVSRVRSDSKEVKGAVVNLKEKYAGLQEDSLVKIEDYSKELENVGAQIKAMQRILQQMVPTMADNISQLQELVTDLKQKKAK
ncbi:MAG: hypothetical protein GOU99_03670 [Candidatus Altiarchaeota archaeon]|nr:hypothetical protein [Candidatus Altiarchaeota archaeon]